MITDSDGILKASAADLLDEVAVEPYVPMSFEDRVALTTSLWEKMEISAHALLNLDPGGEDLPSMCAGMAWVWLHECSSFSGLNKFRRSYKFMCGDMGTEAGLPDFILSEPVTGLFPPWRADMVFAEDDPEGFDVFVGEEKFLPCCTHALGLTTCSIILIKMSTLNYQIESGLLKG